MQNCDQCSCSDTLEYVLQILKAKGEADKGRKYAALADLYAFLFSPV